MSGKLSVLALIAMSVGCAKTESDDLKTSGIYADLLARATGDGRTTVSATLFVDGPNTLNFVELGDHDQLVVTRGSDSQPMTQSELGNIVSNSASFDGDAGGTSYAIAFDRQIDDGAPSSTIVLPPPFDVDPPPATASRAQSVTITWKPDSQVDTMLWTASGACIADSTGSAGGDIGTLTLSTSAFTKRTGSDVADSCMLTFTLSRQRTGRLDAHYGKGGTAIGSQDRMVTWTTTP